MLVDSHCHLDFPAFAEDFDAMLDRARAAGVGRMLTIGTRLGTFDAVRTVAETHDDIYCTVGVHPHEAAGEGIDDPAPLLRRARHDKVVGIGETGLDYYYEHSPRSAQRMSFRTHIEAARRSGLPLIVHTREADDDTVAILEEEHRKGPFAGLIHCFSTSRQLADRAVELGLMISFSGIVTFPRAEALRAIAASLPLDSLLVETDAPYLAPVPHRGRRNEPAYVVHTAAAIAQARGIGADEVAAATTANFFRLFAKVPPPEGRQPGA